MLLEMVAWIQCNLINVHVPRGKKRVRLEDLLPKDVRRRRARKGTAKVMPSSWEEAKEIAREQQRKRDSEAFWATAEGKRLASELFDDGRPPADEPEELVEDL